MADILGNVFANTQRKHAYSYDERLAISTKNQIEMVQNGTFYSWQGVKMANNTPGILTSMGCPDLPVMMSPEKILGCLAPFDDMKHQHGLTADQVLGAMAKVNDAVFIYDSLNDMSGKNDTICAFLDDFGPSLNGTLDAPLLLTIHLNGYERDTDGRPEQAVNYVTGLYGKRPDGFFSQLGKALESGKLLYVNTERVCEIAEEMGMRYKINSLRNKGLFELPSKQVLKQSLAAENTRNNSQEYNEYYKAGNSAFDRIKRQHNDAIRAQEQAEKRIRPVNPGGNPYQTEAEKQKPRVVGNIFDR